MTIGEARSMLESNYEKHYDNVITNNFISKEKAINYIQEQTNCEYDIAKQIVNEWINKGNINSNKKIIIECPYCKSANTTKIPTTAKVVNTAIFGIFGTKKHKQWHCNECGSDF